MKDDLGTRIKQNYENRFRGYLPRRTNTILRIDGKAFHTYTKGRAKPFDKNLMGNMDLTAMTLCKEIQGAKMAYVQSDEISILVTDYDELGTCSWFDGNIQKICSVSASIATSSFYRFELMHFARQNKPDEEFGFLNQVDLVCIDPPNFDSRAFIIPEVSEVSNYFLWRAQDAARNSVQMVARSLYSHKECENKNVTQLKEMINEKGGSWDKLENGKKNGRIISYYQGSYWDTYGVSEVTYDFFNKKVKSAIGINDEEKIS